MCSDTDRDLVVASRLTCRLARTAFICVLTASNGQAQQKAPAPDSALAALVARAIFDSLRGGGSSADMLWIAGDSVTFNALAPVAAGRQITLAPPREDVLRCPDSTDEAGVRVREPTGYHVFIATRADSTGRLSVAAWVRCNFVYKGRASGFGEGLGWELVKDARGWRLGAPRGRWIT